MSLITFQNKRAHNPISELRREVDQLLEDFQMMPYGSKNFREFDSLWCPMCDIEEFDQHYLISLEIPGIPKDQIQIGFQDHQICISGERKKETHTKEKGHLYTERNYGKFQRSFTLPSGIDVEKVQAHYDQGVLRVYIPKSESSKPRKIKIGSGTFFESLETQSENK